MLRTRGILEPPHLQTGLRTLVHTYDRATATESTRDQIIHAAAESLLENGYSGTSAEPSPPAPAGDHNLQYWFPTKSELLVRRGDT
jgi:hypothetical protein